MTMHMASTISDVYICKTIRVLNSLLIVDNLNEEIRNILDL